MKIVVLPSALDHLSDGFYFYERQRGGLGQYFIESLYSDIDSLRLYAGIHIKSFGYHRVLSKRFPYAIYYRLEQNTVQIWAVLDGRQDPSTIRRKLREL
jgi:plasmid stabilization system protein ParE